MKDPHAMTSLSEVMNKLKQDGIKDDFHFTEKEFIDQQTGKAYNPEDVTILKTFRFEGESSPSEMSVLYIIETSDGKKGTYVDAFGTYADYDGQRVAEFFKNVKIIQH